MTYRAVRRWHYRRSLASRVTLLTTIAVGLAMVAMALGSYLTVRSQMQSEFDKSLLDRAQAVARTGAAVREATGQFTFPAWMLGAADVRIFIVQSDGYAGAVDEGSELRLSESELAVARGQSPEALRSVSQGDVTYRMATVPVLGRPAGRALVLAQSTEPQESTLRKLGYAMALFGGAGVIAAGMAGWAVARNGLRPVRRLARAVEEAARTTEMTPLAVEGDDEVARLSIAFNQLVEAVTASQSRQRQLVADASHELRTPLTSLRTNLDLLAQADALPSSALSPEARRELMDDVRAQIEELTTLIGDLTELARDEPRPSVVESVDLADVVDRAVARVRRRAPTLAFDVHAEPWQVRGEPAALERAVTNLLDNAAKWSPPDGTVTVTLSRGTLVVGDEGPGISAADLPHVFERFYRSSESRTMTGSGLGLSIVQQVAHRHGGSVSADNGTSGSGPGPGARLSLSLPPAPS